MSEESYNTPPNGREGLPGIKQGDSASGGAPSGYDWGVSGSQTGGLPAYGGRAIPSGDAKADAAYRKAQRPFYKKKRVIIPGVLLALFVAIGVTSGGGSNAPSAVSAPSAPGEAPAAQAPNSVPAQASAAPKAAAGVSSQGYSDVAITSCATDDAGYAEAGVRITNNSSKASNYFVTVTFNSSDGTSQVGTGMVVVNSLQPSQHSDEKANALKVPNGAFSCVVNPKDVTRYAA
jgi:hypothetical protein